jgi:hypothetical protein
MQDLLRDWQRRLEGHRSSARAAIVIGGLICGIAALGIHAPDHTRPLTLGPFRPALELWSRFFFGFAGPTTLLYGLAVAVGLLYVGDPTRATRLRIVAKDDRVDEPQPFERAA